MNKMTLMVGLLSVAVGTLCAHETDLEKEYKDKHARLAVLTIERDYEELLRTLDNYDKLMRSLASKNFPEQERPTLPYQTKYVTAVRQKILNGLKAGQKEIEAIKQSIDDMWPIEFFKFDTTRDALSEADIKYREKFYEPYLKDYHLSNRMYPDIDEFFDSNQKMVYSIHKLLHKKILKFIGVTLTTGVTAVAATGYAVYKKWVAKKKTDEISEIKKESVVETQAQPA
ncbi:hypothetical protein IPH25_01335 [bacterium]|nr:MAG: hypothetical protein IPG37_03460 [bacterium]QQR62070.1 MAG: hypothetical protein IPH25_01335 [bacterium]QQR62336.1 MAG: hypothetical protein IPH67_02800 [bacterium]